MSDAPNLNTFSGGEGLQVIVHHKKTDEYFVPAVLDGAAWELHRKGAPGKFTFKVVHDDVLKMEYGDTIDVLWDGTQFFHGFIFEKKRNRDKQWDVISYDQMRYLLNKDTFAYIGKKASEVIKELAEDYELLTGDLADTGFVIAKRREPNTTILDMCQNALDLTMIHTDKMFVLHDDCGQLTLKDIEDLQSNILIDSDTAQDFSYTGTIDKGTYNLIKLDVDDGDNGHKVYYSPASNEDYEASETRKQWGVLQFYENANPHNQSPQDLADHLLSHYNRVSRSLTIKGAAGDLSIRGGSMLWMNVHIGDTDWNQEDNEAKLAIVEQVTHHFSNHEHTMDMDVRNDMITGISSGASGGGGGASKSSSKSSGGNISSGVDAGASAWEGQTMDNGAEGCVEAVSKVGSYYSPFLEEECNNGVVSVPTLVSDAESNGIAVEDFNPSNMQKGDVIVYGNQDHVVIYDGEGGYIGNSLSANSVIHGSDYTAMGRLTPTAIIKTSKG